MKLRIQTLAVLTSLTFIFPVGALAEQKIVREVPLKAAENFEGTRVAFTPGDKYHNVTLMISGPADYYAEVFSRSGIPEISLGKHGKVVDGFFNYQMTAATSQVVEIVNRRLNNGREDILGKVPSKRNVGAALSGTFCVEDGKIRPFKDIPEEGKGGDREKAQ